MEKTMASTTELVTQNVADLSTEKPKTFKQMSCKERLSYVREVITVEPIIAGYIIAALLARPAITIFEYDKACHSNLEYADEVCHSIAFTDSENYLNESLAIVSVIGNVHSWQQPIQTVMPIFLILFLGSFSDRHQWRKPFLLLPLFGELFAIGGCILSAIFMRELTLEVFGVLSTVVPSFFGGQTMIVMATFAYIADVSTLEMRTLRIGVVQIVLNACAPFTQSFSAVLFNAIGYIPTFAICGGIYLFTILYGIFFVKEPRRVILGENKSIIADIFDPRHAIETFNVILKKGPGKDRVIVVLMLIIMLFYSTLNTGEDSVFYFYSNTFLNWLINDFTLFLTANTLIHLVGTIIAVPLFTKLMKLSDAVIIILTLGDKMIANVIFGFASSTLVMYIAAVVSLLTGVTPIGIRSLATKVVSEKDLGKAQSLFGIVEALGPAIGTPLYNKGIYLNTIETWPSAFFFFGLILYGLCIALILIIQCRKKLTKKPDPSMEMQQPTIENNLTANGSVDLGTTDATNHPPNGTQKTPNNIEKHGYVNESIQMEEPNNKTNSRIDHTTTNPPTNGIRKSENSTRINNSNDGRTGNTSSPTNGKTSRITNGTEKSGKNSENHGHVNDSVQKENIEKHGYLNEAIQFEDIDTHM